MNTQEYINSGILEEYLLRSVSPQEKQEVECMSKIYPEIKTELAQLESALEQYALMHPKVPPARLKGNIFAQMTFAETAEEAEVPAQPIEMGRQIDFQPTMARTTPLWSRMAVAVSVVLAVVSAWGLWQAAQYKDQNQTLAAEISNVKQQNDYNQSLATMYESPDNKVINLKGVEKSPESGVVAFWNQKTKEVLLNVQSLPIAAAGKQYQLWAIVGDKPVDMGMLDQDFSKKIMKMKIADGNAVAFAITLEKRGGSPSPTLEEMVVIGNI